MKFILSHPTGNANVRAVAEGLAKAGLLHRFHTTIASFSGTLLDSVSIGPLAEIKRRQYNLILKPFTRTNPWMEVARLIAPKVGLHNFIKHETGRLSVDAVYRNNDKKVADSLIPDFKGEKLGVYAYEDGAKYTFEKANRLGIPCYYDLPIGYWKAARRLLKDEISKWPDWESTLIGFQDSDAKLLHKDDELRLASQIFVASSFTAKTLQDFSGNLAPVTVIPYGYPPVESSRTYTTSSHPLRVLFVGGLSQRKGIANMFAAVEKFGKHVELTVVGRKASNDCEALDIALAKHKWIPSLPHHEILKLMRQHDVLLFPSLFEGFGLVITEAMSQGTPVITTDRTAGPDLIEHGRNGWLIEASNTEAIEAAIENLLLNPHEIAKNGAEAMQSAKLRPWSVYGQELAVALGQPRSI
ncbi:glycosyltransferase family 4 protein [Mucilaginibacter sp. Bleaf8]|uniref:glycosyltransferase family 4 protein n=1 Tax=Mucilaginibacter sp. Bleaf8 TaxID=2834430 RepID=UPI001BCB8C1D|nr:glycosyltransferase family 4 protein [Mucilaginibacter sp. Bleaf8]MBS7566458.1 glycosyltransferase family 4 protein [Mucilaginibacter sp. Bleaf8]